MPYCCHCGKEARAGDRYCGSCGAPQAAAGGGSSEILSSVSPRAAALMCYIPVVGWIPAIVVLAAQRFRDNRFVRFHAFQGLYLFVAWLLVDWVIGPLLHLPGMSSRIFPMSAILKAVIFFTWIFMIVKTSQEETFKLPVLGELAERSVSEQR